MNKFVSFEMVFNNRERFMGNMIIPCPEIITEQDVSYVENVVRERLNRDCSLIEKVDIVTLINWKAI